MKTITMALALALVATPIAAQTTAQGCSRPTGISVEFWDTMTAEAKAAVCSPVQQQQAAPPPPPPPVYNVPVLSESERLLQRAMYKEANGYMLMIDEMDVLERWTLGFPLDEKLSFGQKFMLSNAMLQRSRRQNAERRRQLPQNAVINCTTSGGGTSYGITRDSYTNCTVKMVPAR